MLNNILKYWYEMEFFAPSWPIDMSTDEKISEKPWLWNFPQSKPGTQISYNVYIGKAKSGDLIEYMFKKLNKEDDEKIEHDITPTCVCALKVDQNGKYVENSFALSTFAWAIHTLANSKKLSINKFEEQQKALNDEILEMLQENARIFKALQENGVQVVYRPFQEMNASWFWWCVAQDRNHTEGGAQNLAWINGEYFKNVWKYVYKYYTETLGLDNLVWVFSPNNHERSAGLTTIMNCYPGDGYVDIVGVDWYTNGKRATEIEEGGCYYNLAQQSGKTAGLCEFGPTQALADKGTYTAESQLADFTALIGKGYKFSYVLNWNGPWSIAGMGGGREYMNSSYTLSQSDVKKMFDQLSK